MVQTDAWTAVGQRAPGTTPLLGASHAPWLLGIDQKEVARLHQGIGHHNVIIRWEWPPALLSRGVDGEALLSVGQWSWSLNQSAK